ncbi:uncharacterized protein NEMAJ01_0791 [Nematocida major]|uniref:uncharacterized protein n=1 Tax=Nematocida major TaxID=1912982 RepID=UPI002007EB9B|nr:uncharacterized protein NEMAJ01_0791 [Nematocida major]KAH9385895.1 hypothetical protein NEMAJ01_0791 [Nematocida major]
MELKSGERERGVDSPGEEREEEAAMFSRGEGDKNARVKAFMDVFSILSHVTGHVLVVTPLRSEASTLEKTCSGLEGVQVSIAGAKRAEELLSGPERIDIVILRKYKILEEMQVLSGVMEAVGDRQVIVSLEGGDEVPSLEGFALASKKVSKREFFIHGETIFQKMAVVFSVTKARPIRNLCVIVGWPKEERRVEVFLRAFGMRVEVNPPGRREGVIGVFRPDSLAARKEVLEKYSLVVDMSNGAAEEALEDVKTTVLRVVSPRTAPEDARFARIRDAALQYKYRIESVLNMITRHVMQGKAEIDEASVKHLHGPLRLL